MPWRLSTLKRETTLSTKHPSGASSSVLCAMLAIAVGVKATQAPARHPVPLFPPHDLKSGGQVDRLAGAGHGIPRLPPRPSSCLRRRPRSSGHPPRICSLTRCAPALRPEQGGRRPYWHCFRLTAWAEVMGTSRISVTSSSLTAVHREGSQAAPQAAEGWGRGGNAVTGAPGNPLRA